MEVTIPQVDDFHHHFRDGEVLKDTVRHASRMFRRAVSGRVQLVKERLGVNAMHMLLHNRYSKYIISLGVCTFVSSIRSLSLSLSLALSFERVCLTPD